MKYACTVCGYIYDDDEHDIPFEQLPDTWCCPLCGAPKALFKKIDETHSQHNEPSKEEPSKEESSTETNEFLQNNDLENDDLVLLSPGELSALFSNLARGCEKQYQQEAMNCFNEIAGYFENITPTETNIDLQYLANLIKEDLDTNYNQIMERANKINDRGTLRITTWGQKVTIMAKNLIDRYLREGDSFLKNTGLYICTVCGFLFVGDNPPEICPVCKVPSWKFEEINGRTKI